MVQFILGGNNKNKLESLKNIGFLPDLVVDIDIDKSPLKREKAIDYIKRISKNGMLFLQAKYKDDIFLITNSIIYRNGRFFRECENETEYKNNLKQFSGNSIKIMTSVCIYSEMKVSQKIVETTLKCKHFSLSDIDNLIKSGEWVGMVGGINMSGLFGALVHRIIGSYGNIVGFPLYEITNMLISAGIKRKTY
jgi:predicted house-cleaning NTP pyrophosphatase (Maf/HAM1 superfamily)